MGSWAIVPLFCGSWEGTNSPSPLPTSPFQTRPIQSGVALKSQATQQPGPALTRDRPHPAPGYGWSVLLSSPHPCQAGVFTCVYMHRHSL